MNNTYAEATKKWCECKYAKKDKGFACSKINTRIMLKCCYKCEDFDKKEEMDNE